MVFPLAFAFSFLLGRLGSTLLYQATWNNGVTRRFHPWGALATLLGRPWPWLVHIPVIALSAGLDWQGMPRLQIFTWVAAGALSLGAVGRWGAVDIGRFFVFDRFLIGVLWLGLWLSPVFLYPLLLACCCLQYTVSGWLLNPGYSNLLGFEFMRSSLCSGLAALLVRAGLLLLESEGLAAPSAGMAPESHLAGVEDQVLALVLCGQAGGYVQQALAKSALGKRWYSWILENRLQCLVVNAHLRGWGAEWVKTAWVLRLARWLSRVRVPLCGAVWLIEIGWLLILADPRLALGILSATAAFHLAVWLLTGLAGYHYAISHVLMMTFAASPSTQALFRPEFALIGGFCILSSSVWVLLLRRRLFREYARSGSSGRWGRAADPADHLMAWWDGPYMRMYSYSVKTSSGRRYRFPVTRFSPYDTFLTDIQTHLMILGRDWELDPQIGSDRAIVRTGVWGLCVSLEDRDRLYELMDDPLANLSVLNPVLNPVVNSVLNPVLNPDAADSPLTAFFRGLNRYQGRRWFRVLFLWPHFPGEDRVPDWSPLAGEHLPGYAGTEPVTEVTCHCIKTFYRGDSIHRVQERVFARFSVNPSDPDPIRDPKSTGPGLRSSAATSSQEVST